MLEEEFLVLPMDALLGPASSSVPDMVRQRALDDLALLYQLYSGVTGGLQAVSVAVQACLECTGKQIFEQEIQIGNLSLKQPAFGQRAAMAVEKQVADAGAIDHCALIQSTLDLKTLWDHILKTSFHNDVLFQRAIQASFVNIINCTPRTPEYLSLYIDVTLRKYPRGVTNDDFDSVSDNCIGKFTVTIYRTPEYIYCTPG